MRIMNAGVDQRYSYGYRVYKNGSGQPVDVNGKPTGRANTHIPVGADGSCAVRVGWPN
jgi:hypothetical protein